MPYLVLNRCHSTLGSPINLLWQAHMLWRYESCPQRSYRCRLQARPETSSLLHHFLSEPVSKLVQHQGVGFQAPHGSVVVLGYSDGVPSEYFHSEFFFFERRILFTVLHLPKVPLLFKLRGERRISLGRDNPASKKNRNQK